MENGTTNNDDGVAGVGACRSFLAVLEQAGQLARIPRPILIRGERGTGKELLARFIHASSPRSAKPYVIVNCGAFQEELLVSHLFGHERGAFTGATQRRIGIFEQAAGGIVFLDEIANLSLTAQARLHRVVEYKTFQRLGSTKPTQVDVQIIAATNADLKKLIKDGRFMADLYDRLCFAELVLPPLRKRRDDIPLLIDHFIDQLQQEVPDLGNAEFTDDAVGELKSYHWPGNIRELKNVVERLYVSDRDRVIHPNELPLEIIVREAIGGTFHEKCRAFEKALLVRALRDTRGNQKDAAHLLGMTYDQFRHYFKKYDLADA